MDATQQVQNTFQLVVFNRMQQLKCNVPPPRENKTSTEVWHLFSKPRELKNFKLHLFSKLTAAHTMNHTYMIRRQTFTNQEKYLQSSLESHKFPFIRTKFTTQNKPRIVKILYLSSRDEH